MSETFILTCVNFFLQNLKPEIKYGFMAALLLIIWHLVQFALQFHTLHFEFLKFTFLGLMLILFLTLLPTLREKRHDYSGHLSLRSGLRSGLLQLFITASVASGFMVIYDYRINKLWVEEYVKWQNQHGSEGFFMFFANDPSASPETFILSNTEMHLVYYFMSILFIGGFFSVLITSLMRDKKIRKEAAEETVSAKLRHSN